MIKIDSNTYAEYQYNNLEAEADVYFAYAISKDDYLLNINDQRNTTNICFYAIIK